ncbi:ATP-binding cassette domain-containing protein [Planctobacterium marinum]|uniref:ABC transporter domain-containing protein n=1 Tax=Planctobacterium marinum TaxID=1631968 RepID=A0AA48HZR3_9ALTE|nr:hypothetical protein MACH26_31360 [Planctobacterium marinum]
MPVYQIAGFTLESPIELPSLSQSLIETRLKVELTIKVNIIPSFTTIQCSRPLDGGEYQWLDGGFRLFHPKVGEIVLQQGFIYWQQLHPVDIEGFRTFLLNTILPAYAILKDMLSLHVSAVSVAGQAIAFQGHSGAGKSTLAAMLMQRGYPVITEDLGIVELNEQTAIMRAGVPYFRLWRQTLKYLNETPQPHNRAWLNKGKYYQSIEDDKFCLHPQPIRAIYFLKEPEQGNSVAIKTMTGFSAAKALLNSYFFGLQQNNTTKTEQLFKKTMVLANQTLCFELVRPKNFAMTEQVLDALVQHWGTF